MSQMSNDLSVGTSDIQYKAPCASSYDTSGLSTWVSEIQAPQVQMHDRPRHETRPINTYNMFLIRRMFGRRHWCILFYYRNYSFIL
jgi:hypothetical protein